MLGVEVAWEITAGFVVNGFWQRLLTVCIETVAHATVRI
jgi:ABC-type lipoprotein release transport system permease subunit